MRSLNSLSFGLRGQREAAMPSSFWASSDWFEMRWFFALLTLMLLPMIAAVIWARYFVPSKSLASVFN